ncbi:MAG: SDR family oxidoreductase [Phycisphaerales bacterium]|nr:SDR family oxidoreductase [Hyphomonadaceae bacterium]
MIIVTGATGKLGRQIVEALLAKLPAEQVGASARDLEKANDLAQRGVRVRRGDFSDPHSLIAAFEGASQVLIVSSNARASGGDPLAQHRAAIDAARASGVRRIVYTSHLGVSSSSAFPPMHDHAATEAMLRDAGIAWTALRNGFYASTVPTMIGDASSSGVLAAPQDGKVSWTTHSDLAEAAAAILLQEGRFDGPTPPLTASEALDLADIAGILSDLHGKPIERRIITDDEQAAAMTERGAQQGAVDATLGLYRAARAGEFAALDSTLATLIGRNPMRLRAVLAAGSDT